LALERLGLSWSLAPTPGDACRGVELDPRYVDEIVRRYGGRVR
jgi:hypothetical protein